jgi:hypothetical protein
MIGAPVGGMNKQDASSNGGRVALGHPNDGAAAIIDRLVHHAEIVGLKGNSYRIRGKGAAVSLPPAHSRLTA